MLSKVSQRTLGFMEELYAHFTNIHRYNGRTIEYGTVESNEFGRSSVIPNELIAAQIAVSDHGFGYRRERYSLIRPVQRVLRYCS